MVNKQSQRILKFNGLCEIICPDYLEKPYENRCSVLRGLLREGMNLDEFCAQAEKLNFSNFKKIKQEDIPKMNNRNAMEYRGKASKLIKYVTGMDFLTSSVISTAFYGLIIQNLINKQSTNPTS